MPELTEQNSRFPEPPPRTEAQSAPPPSTPTQTAGAKKDQVGVALFSIEGIAMLIWAFLLDMLGIVINFLLPVIGFITTML